MSKLAEPESSESEVNGEGAASAPRVKASPTFASVLWQMLTIAASLRITVVLFVLSLFLVFAGTMAQKDFGLWTVLHDYFRTGIAWIPLQIFVRFGQVFLGVSPYAEVAGSFPFPGGWLIGGLLLGNLLAAHAVRFKLTWKRSGILVIHAGMVVIMLGELFTGLFAVEGRMTIDEGKASNYSEDLRHFELAFVDKDSDADKDTVTVIPGSMLGEGATINKELLPVTVEVVRYMRNSKLLSPKEIGEQELKVENPANAQTGLQAVAIAQPEVTGTASKQTIDIPAAYVTFKDKESGKPMGTYLLSLGLKPQPLKVGDKTYQVSLRFERSYKSCWFHLIKFTVDRYEGTNKPKEYSSKIKLMDSNGDGREVTISMNAPLRFEGDTYFQADFDKETEKTTVLQVVKNPAADLPYIACIMVGCGMLFHFGMHLQSFLTRRMAL